MSNNFFYNFSFICWKQYFAIDLFVQYWLSEANMGTFLLIILQFGDNPDNFFCCAETNNTAQ